jgi:hypothetical protein
MAVENGVSATWLSRRLGRTPEAVRWRKLRLLGRTPAPGRYTASEDDAIRRAVDEGGALGAVALDLGRSVEGVRVRAQKLGVHQPRRRRRWTSAEDAVLRDGYDAGRSCAGIASTLRGRSGASVAARARKLGLSNYGRAWTVEDDDLLIRLIEQGRSTTEIARATTRTPEAVRRRSRVLRATAAAASPPRSARPWTEREDAILRRHAGANPALLAEALGRTDRAIAARLRRLGLRNGRERSPHHPATIGARLTPAQRSTILREADPRRAEHLLALARRLEVPAESVRRTLDARVDRQAAG